MTVQPASLAAARGLLAPTAAPGTGTTLQKSDGSSSVFGLGKDDFFKLFLAQLKNQDPTQPVDDKEFVSQLAQFSMIDTMKAVEKALAGTQLAQAAGLIGKHVQGPGVDGTPVAGVVDRLVQDDTGLTLVVGTALIRPNAVSVVTEPAPAGIV